ncbi:MAG: hypothetical protein JWP78_3660 [Mucilaginibacter sp.]|nr:hypothetical protein [Mucilaginibacter sp.]
MVITGCKKLYTPNITASNVSYLVVEGVINTGLDSTIIKLSRTVNVSDKVKTVSESGAQVTVESDQNNSYTLNEIGNGKYASAALSLNAAYKYRLHIKTTAGKEYFSDFEAVKPNPPIDSVGFTIQNNGIQLYVNTHDGAKSTGYYRWEYTETWNFHARYQTTLITDGTKLNYRTPDQQIYSCFGNNISSTVLLGSTARLSNDVIYQQPLTQISSASEKLEIKYSILVKQYALTSDAYNFWQNLKKNAEQLGTIFAPLPSELSGNIHCITTPSEPVIGYVSTTNIQQKRIFISYSQLPESWRPAYPYQCTLDTLLLYRGVNQNDVALFLIPIGSTEFAVSTLSSKTGTLIGYLGADAECADCTIRGTNKPPAFWINN